MGISCPQEMNVSLRFPSTAQKESNTHLHYKNAESVGTAGWRKNSRNSGPREHGTETMTNDCKTQPTCSNTDSPTAPLHHGASSSTALTALMQQSLFLCEPCLVHRKGKITRGRNKAPLPGLNALRCFISFCKCT